jgi:hypothetical protein
MGAVMATNARIYYDRHGTIVTVVEVKTDRSAPSAELFSAGDFASLEKRFATDEPLLEIHTGYRVDLSAKQPRLVKIEKKKPSRSTK